MCQGVKDVDIQICSWIYGEEVKVPEDALSWPVYGCVLPLTSVTCN